MTLPDPLAQRMRRRSSPLVSVYLVRELSFPVCFVLAGLALALITTDLLAYADLVVNRGLAVGSVVSIAFFRVVPALSQALPFAVLVGSLVALGRLGADREILALEASGIWARRLVSPVVLFSAIATVLGLFLSVAAAPWAARQLDVSLVEMLRRNPGAGIQAGKVYEVGEWRLQAREVSARGDDLRGVMVWVPAIGETAFADRGSVESDGHGRAQLTVEDGFVVLNPRNGPRRIRFERLAAQLPPVSEAVSALSDDIAGATMSELGAVSDPGSPDYRRTEHIEWHRRLALPFATLLFGFLAVPLFVSRSHFSRSGGAVLGIAATVVYYCLVQLGNGLSRGGTLSIAAAVWMPNVVFAALGILLFARVNRFSSFGRDPVRLRLPWRSARERVRESGGRIRAHRWPLARYVSVRFLQTAGICFGGLLAIFLLVDVVDNLKWFAKYHASVGEVLRFYGARLPVLAVRVVPLALVVAASLTVSLLAVQGEVMGIRACGIAPARAFLPILALCAVSAIAYHLFNSEIVPRSSAVASHLKRTEIKNRPENGSPRRASMWYRAGDRVYTAERLDPFIGYAERLTIYELDDDGRPERRTDARLARHIGRGMWHLTDPVSVRIQDGALTVVDAPPYVELGKEVAAEVDTAHLTPAELLDHIAEVEASGLAATTHRVDYQAKLAAPLACLLLPALALLYAVGGPPYPTPAATLLLSLVAAVGHVLLTGVWTALGYGGTVPPVVAGWGPTLVMTLLAAWLVLRLRAFGQSFF